MAGQFTLSRKLTYLTGFSPGVLLRTLREIPRFLADLCKYRKMNRQSSFRITSRHLFPILTDRGESAGVASGHYFHQDLWAAKRVFGQAPERHVDIGSRVDGFVAHLLVFMPVTIIDIRHLESKISNLDFVRDDAATLSSIADDSLASVSSLHAAEHFGLGRYSDPIDPSACFRFMNALQRVLAPGGRLYFSVPVGHERVEFNAHRVFAPNTILDNFSQLELLSFAYVGDDGDLREQAKIVDAARCEYGCGLFEFTKPATKKSQG
jgi:SAM-dependent methyltransferase